MKITKYIAAFSVALSFVACDDYLDTLPDNRAEIDSEEKIALLLVSAYPESDYLLLNEYMSDNVDDFGANNPNTDRFLDQVYKWEEITETNNEDPQSLWESCYQSVAAANQALISIEELGDEATPSLQESKGEALACRAFAHFILVNEFCKAYNTESSSTDKGIPYVTKAEKELKIHYERGTVAEVYKNIEADILQAIELVNNGTSKVKKYHFSKQALYAFAARFYLFTEQWAKAEQYATLCLGEAPENVLRDWKEIANMTQKYDAVAYHYVSTSVNSNLLLITAYSSMGLCFGPYRYFSRYAHGLYLADNETVNARNVWGVAGYYHEPKEYSATNLEKVVWWKSLYVFEELDATNHIGRYRTVYPAFTTDEVLLTRAEARIMQEKYADAATDLNIWKNNIINNNKVELTPELIQEFYNSVEYSTGLSSTVKKHLNPSFNIGAEGELKETMLQCVLGFRRIETLQMGLRWWDIRRYGIEIVRREMNLSSQPYKVTDTLTVDDPRRQLQIPTDVVSAGFEKNER